MGNRCSNCEANSRDTISDFELALQRGNRVPLYEADDYSDADISAQIQPRQVTPARARHNSPPVSPQQQQQQLEEQPIRGSTTPAASPSKLAEEKPSVLNALANAPAAIIDWLTSSTTPQTANHSRAFTASVITSESSGLRSHQTVSASPSQFADQSASQTSSTLASCQTASSSQAPQALGDYAANLHKGLATSRQASRPRSFFPNSRRRLRPRASPGQTLTPEPASPDPSQLLPQSPHQTVEQKPIPSPESLPGTLPVNSFPSPSTTTESTTLSKSSRATISPPPMISRNFAPMPLAAQIPKPVSFATDQHSSTKSTLAKLRALRPVVQRKAKHHHFTDPRRKMQGGHFLRRPPPVPESSTTVAVGESTAIPREEQHYIDEEEDALAADPSEWGGATPSIAPSFLAVKPTRFSLSHRRSVDVTRSLRTRGDEEPSSGDGDESAPSGGGSRPGVPINPIEPTDVEVIEEGPYNLRDDDSDGDEPTKAENLRRARTLSIPGGAFTGDRFAHSLTSANPRPLVALQPMMKNPLSLSQIIIAALPASPLEEKDSRARSLTPGAAHLLRLDQLNKFATSSMSQRQGQVGALAFSPNLGAITTNGKAVPTDDGLGDCDSSIFRRSYNGVLLSKSVDHTWNDNYDGELYDGSDSDSSDDSELCSSDDEDTSALEFIIERRIDCYERRKVLAEYRQKQFFEDQRAREERLERIHQARMQALEKLFAQEREELIAQVTVASPTPTPCSSQDSPEEEAGQRDGHTESEGGQSSGSDLETYLARLQIRHTNQQRLLAGYNESELKLLSTFHANEAYAMMAYLRNYIGSPPDQGITSLSEELEQVTKMIELAKFLGERRRQRYLTTHDRKSQKIGKHHRFNSRGPLQCRRVFPPTLHSLLLHIRILRNAAAWHETWPPTGYAYEAFRDAAVEGWNSARRSRRKIGPELLLTPVIVKKLRRAGNLYEQELKRYYLQAFLRGDLPKMITAYPHSTTLTTSEEEDSTSSSSSSSSSADSSSSSSSSSESSEVELEEGGVLDSQFIQSRESNEDDEPSELVYEHDEEDNEEADEESEGDDELVSPESLDRAVSESTLQSGTRSEDDERSAKGDSKHVVISARHSRQFARYVERIIRHRLLVLKRSKTLERLSLLKRKPELVPAPLRDLLERKVPCAWLLEPEDDQSIVLPAAIIKTANPTSQQSGASQPRHTKIQHMRILPPQLGKPLSSLLAPNAWELQLQGHRQWLDSEARKSEAGAEANGDTEASSGAERTSHTDPSLAREVLTILARVEEFLQQEEAERARIWREKLDSAAFLDMSSSSDV